MTGSLASSLTFFTKNLEMDEASESLLSDRLVRKGLYLDLDLLNFRLSESQVEADSWWAGEIEDRVVFRVGLSLILCINGND